KVFQRVFEILALELPSDVLDRFHDVVRILHDGSYVGGVGWIVPGPGDPDRELEPRTAPLASVRSRSHECGPDGIIERPAREIGSAGTGHAHQRPYEAQIAIFGD